ncbi:MAG: DUF4382 domain-containing protein [Thermosipho sp. (in: Bacteria)]|nr:DUF4382 domain-containing protein [Thermosipho sp. (in: thermotogales)]
MKKSLVWITLTLSLFVLFSCIFNKPLQKATVEVLLTDSPVTEIDKLTIDIIGFTYHYAYEDATGNETGIWATPTNIATTVDILSLAGTEVSWLTIEVPVPSTITQLRIFINDATVTVSGEDPTSVTLSTKEVKIPKTDITINDDGQLILDFDVLRSLKFQNGNYRLTPVILPTFRNYEVYPIYGEVSQNSSPVSKAVVALFDSDDSTSLKISLTKSDGTFYLGKWHEGDYIIKVSTGVQIPEDEQDFDLTNYTETASKTIEVPFSDPEKIQLQ